MNVNYGYNVEGIEQIPVIKVSPQEEAKQLATRREVIPKYRNIALITIAAAVVSIIVGIFILIQVDTGGFPLTSAAPIWPAVLMLIGSGFGLALGMQSPEWKTDSDRFKQRCFLMTYYIMSFTSMLFLIFSTMFLIWSLAVCAYKDSEDGACNTNFNALIALNVVAILIGIFLFICFLAVAITYFKTRRAFQLYSIEDQLELLKSQQVVPAMQINLVNTSLQPTTQIGTGFRHDQYSQFGTSFGAS